MCIIESFTPLVYLSRFYGIGIVLYWNCIGIVLELYWNCIGIVSELYWNCIGIVLELYWNCIGIVLELYVNCIGIVLELYWNYMLGICRELFVGNCIVIVLYRKILIDRPGGMCFCFTHNF